MLGAQTRAAEYYAAKRASARQASREAEEQKLPPPAAPISLGAYTRSAQPSRNKGLKAYIPLILEQTPEADAEAEQSTFETPTRQPPRSECESASTSDSSSVTRPRVMLPGLHNVPTMPRGMMVIGGPLNTVNQARLQNAPPLQHHVSFPPPPHYHHAGFPYQPEFAFQHHEYAYPHFPMLHHQPYSYEPQTQPFRPQHTPSDHQSPLVAPSRYEKPKSCPIDIQRPPSTPQTPQKHKESFVFGPDDMTPPKQEAKLCFRSRLPSDGKRYRGLSADDYEDSDYDRPLLNPIRFRGSSSDDSELSSHTPSRSIVRRTPVVTSIPRLVQPLRIDTGMHSDTSQQRGIFPNPLRRYTDTDMSSDSPVTAVPWNKVSFDDEPNSSDATHRGRYERSTKMQKFEAVQQVLIKKGKTVLNNPERKTPARVAPISATPMPRTPVPVAPMPAIPVSRTPGAESGPGPSVIEDEVKDLSNATKYLQPPPGLQKPEFPFVPDMISGSPDIATADNLNTGSDEVFGIVDADWFHVKPVSLQERKDMQSLLRNVRKRDARAFRGSSEEAEISGFRPGAVEWLKRDPRLFQAARQEIDMIAKQYSVRLHAGSRYEMPLEGEVDLAAGLVRGSGGILASLNENLVKGEGSDYFYRTKSVPDSAIDEGM